MKDKKFVLLSVILILLSFAFPVVASAAWWNPLSWTWNPLSWIRVSPPKTKIIEGDPNKLTTPSSTPVTQSPVPSTIKSKQDLNKQRVDNKSQLQQASKNLSNRNIIAKVKPAVVYIETSSGSGSGMIVESSGYILTNAHVVLGFNSTTVTMSDGRKFLATVIGRDENIDVALLKISVTGLTTVTLGNSDSIEQGDPVFTLGYPLGIEGDVSFKDGTLSRRLINNGISYLEISAQILPGNSGGPLVDQSGQVIGINTFAIGTGKISGALVGETLKFALPINTVKPFIPQLKNGRNVILPKTSTTPIPKTPSSTLPPIIIIMPTPRQTIPPISPKISNIHIQNVFTDSATIRWDRTSLYIDVALEYGTNPNLSGSKTINTGSDGVLIDGSLSASTPLKPGTTYYFRVNSKNSAGEEFHSDIYSFKTLLPPTPIPNIFTFSFDHLTYNSVKIKWSRTSGVGTSSDSVIEYSTSSNFDNSLKQGLGYSGYLNYVELSGLQENTTYYYRLNLKDLYGKSVPDSNVGSFTTASLSTPTPTPTPSETATPLPSETPTPTP